MTSPREAWDALLAWYGPQTTGAKSDLSRRLNSFKIAPGSNPLEETGECGDGSGRMEEGESTWQVGDEAWIAIVEENAAEKYILDDGGRTGSDGWRTCCR